MASDKINTFGEETARFMVEHETIFFWGPICGWVYLTCIIFEALIWIEWFWKRGRR